MIELKDVVMQFPGHCALNDLNLSVSAGHVYGLLGPNGAGKSTTINLVTGLLKPTSGSIHIDGIDVVAEPERARSLIAYVSESVALYPHLTGIENLQLFSKLAGRQLDTPETKACLDRAGRFVCEPQDHFRRPKIRIFHGNSLTKYIENVYPKTQLLLNWNSRLER